MHAEPTHVVTRPSDNWKFPVKVKMMNMWNVIHDEDYVKCR